jgi:predicted permease
VLRIGLNKLNAPPWVSIVPDWRVLLFTVAVTLIAALLFGLMPALQIARQRQHKTIARQILVGAQVAASCVLLIVAGLLVRATQHALYSDPGFGYQKVLSIDAQLSQHGYTAAAAKAYLDQMQSRLLSIPVVKSVSLVKVPPLGHVTVSEKSDINGHTVTIYPNWVEGEFFQTMGIPVLRGRTFHPGERRAVIVSESFAREQWPGVDPIGQQMGDGPDKDTVVGVVGNARINALSDDDATEQYWPAQLADMPNMVVIARTAAAPDQLPPVIKSISESLNLKLIPEVRQLKLLYQDNVSGIENTALIVSLIGLVSVLVAGIGIIGLVAFTISQRTKEIAIRFALGAKRVQVLAAVLRQFAWPVVLGIVAAIGIASVVTKILRRALYGINNLDPLSYMTAVAVLLIIVGLAALMPARRALYLNLAKALRCE